MFVNIQSEVKMFWSGILNVKMTLHAIKESADDILNSTKTQNLIREHCNYKEENNSSR